MKIYTLLSLCIVLWAQKAITFHHKYSLNHMALHEMNGMYGMYPSSRDATGTSWMPDSTKMPGIHKMHEDWLMMIHGYINAIYDRQGGPRGGKKFFSENMFMITTQQTNNQRIIALRGMISFEPGTIGAKGYPLLLQTGETANGITPLIDRQHPHDLFMELAGVYTWIFSEKRSLFIYGGMPGEPALGPPTYIHRFSALFNPEAPLTHHWLDSTHITFGVITFGFVQNWFKLDTSIFTGREPDQHRWDFERPRFDSYSVRLSANPIQDIAAQISYGFLKSPEQLEPEIDTHRTTASISYNKAWKNNNWQTTFAWGRNNNIPGHILNGYLLESTIEVHGEHIIFGRAEYVAKDELFIPPSPLAGKIFKVGKIDVGYIFEFPLIPFTKWGIGFVISASFVPREIKKVYGGTPISGMVFLRAELNQ